MAKLPHPHPTSSTRCPSWRASFVAHELELGLLGLLERRARPTASTRTSRSSSGRGTGRRSRCRRCSGGARPGGRGQIVWRSPRRRSSACGGRGGRTIPHARTSATASRAIAPGPSDGASKRVDDAQGAIEVVDVDQPGHVGAAEAELTRRAQDMGERRGRVDLERRCAGLGGRHGAAVPEADREWPSGQRRRELAAQRSGVGEHYAVSAGEGLGGASARGRRARRPRPGRRPPWRGSSPLTGRSARARARGGRRSGTRGGCCARPRPRWGWPARRRCATRRRCRKSRRPKKWHTELIENVAWCTKKIRAAPPHSRPLQAAGHRAGEQRPRVRTRPPARAPPRARRCDRRSGSTGPPAGRGHSAARRPPPCPRTPSRCGRA